MRRIGQIQCIEVTSAAPSNQQGSANQQESRLIVLFHGYGADAHDLQTLSDVIETPWPADFLFPQGPLEVPIGPGWTGRAWWNIDLMALQIGIAEGKERDLAKENPEGLTKIRPKILEMLQKTGVPWNRIILGGFSQGAMLATDIFLNAPESPAGLLLFSGNLICREQWKELAKNRQGSHFFQSHGQSDAVLPYGGAQRLETLLTQAGMKGRLNSFQGGHEIPMATLQKASDYLREYCR